MTLSACKYSTEINTHLAAGDWPHAASTDLRTHANSCRTCSDLILVISTFQAARAASIPQAKLPPPGVLWWRAQLRRRNAVETTIRRPLLGAQIFALVICVAAFTVLLATQIHNSQQWAKALSNLPQYFDLSRILNLSSFSMSSLSGLSSNPAMLIPGLALLALLTGVVLYLATEKQ
jgi:hypothetical protein